MKEKFIDRISELNALEEKYKSGKAEFVIIYGRRRVGKTEIIKKFIEKKDHIYFLADKTIELDQLKNLSQSVGSFFKDSILMENGFSGWISFFKYIEEKSERKRLIVVIDEFPFLMEGNKAIPSLFQKGWDEYLKDSNIFLILCGSSMTMMERGTLSYKSPLYGRRTGQMLLAPISFEFIKDFFPDYSIEQLIETYAILGGIPAYLKQFNPKINVEKNIKYNILRKDISFLYMEAEFLLQQELREPRTYLSILKNISFGKTKTNEIASSVGMERNTVSMYITTLEKLGFIKKDIPITEANSHKSRKGVYRINDNYLRFWLRFILPNRGLLEEDKMDYVYTKLIKTGFNIFVSLAFESICRMIISRVKIPKQLIHYEKTGRWWGHYRKDGERKELEIDIVALNEETKDILFCECKWKENVNSEKILKDLKEKTIHVQWNNDKRKEKFVLFAKSFSNRPDEKDALCFDLKDIEKALKSS